MSADIPCTGFDRRRGGLWKAVISANVQASELRSLPVQAAGLPCLGFLVFSLMKGVMKRGLLLGSKQPFCTSVHKRQGL